MRKKKIDHGAIAADAEEQSIYGRVKQCLGAASDGDLARRLQASRQRVGNWKSTGVVPMQVLYDISVSDGISLDWLAHGEGPAYREDRNVRVAKALNGLDLEQRRALHKVIEVRALARLLNSVPVEDAALEKVLERMANLSSDDVALLEKLLEKF